MIANNFKTAVCILMASPLLFVACDQRRERSGASAHPMPTVSVSVRKAELEPIILAGEVVGTVRAKTRATLEAKQAGRIEKFPKNLGDKVRAGELVAELDAAESAARVEQAEASVEHVERDWKRVAALFEANSATRAERDAAESRLRGARADLAEKRASLGQMRIISPFDGVVTRKWAEAGDMAAPGKPIVEIEDPAVLQVEIEIPESFSEQVKLNSKLVVLRDQGASASGIVAELSPAFDSVTRTRRAKLEIKEGSFASGQFVRVSIPGVERKAILLPKAAVVERGQLEMVFTLEKDHARMRLVKTRALGDGRFEMLSGLSAGESVVVEGADRLIDGQPVEVK